MSQLASYHPRTTSASILSRKTCVRDLERVEMFESVTDRWTNEKVKRDFVQPRESNYPPIA